MYTAMLSLFPIVTSKFVVSDVMGPGAKQSMIAGDVVQTVMISIAGSI